MNTSGGEAGGETNNSMYSAGTRADTEQRYI